MADTQKFVPDDAPPSLKSAVRSCENLLKSYRKLRNQEQATDDDVDDARQARDMAWSILERGNWKR